jgi:hypothetical protein
MNVRIIRDDRTKDFATMKKRGLGRVFSG